MGYDNFKNDICSYYNSFEITKNKLNKLKSALDNIVNNILPQRDSEYLFQIRDFTNTSDLNINFNFDNIFCYYSEEKEMLITGVICPNWSKGWSCISKDKFISEQISHLFHFVSQYIYRSYQVNLIGAIALATGRHTDFRGDILECAYGKFAIQKIDNFKSNIGENTSKLSMKTIGYLKLINALDPYVNKAIFYYIRSIELDDADFTEESITAADNMVDIIFQSIKKRLNEPTKERNKMCDYVYREIGIYDGADIDNLERLYLLRCSFTAHPAKSKWWDFYEMYEDDIEEIKLTVRKFLVIFLKYENRNRKVDSHPTSWSKWFKEYCDIIYDVVWFHDIP